MNELGTCLDEDDKTISTPNLNQCLKTMLHVVQFEDGTSQAYNINLIAENMRRTTNNKGYYKDTLHSIVSIRFDSNAVKDCLICDKHDKS